MTMFGAEIETEDLLNALDHVGDDAAAALLEVARVTAEAIVREARARVARRTGETAEGLHVELTHAGDGYVVRPSFRLDEISLHTNQKTGRIHTQRVTQNNRPIWLEFGTKYMTAQPYFFVSVDLEREPHRRRMAEALMEVITEWGLAA